MSLDQIITVNITRETTSVSQTGFGTGNLVGFFPTSIFPERSRVFSSLQGLLDVGFIASDPIYGMASNLLAQNPSPSQFKIGRRIGAPQQVLHLTPVVTAEADTYTLSITGYADSVFASRASVTDTQTESFSVGSDAEAVVDGIIALIAETGDYTLSKSGTGSSAVLVITADNTTMDGLLFGVTVTNFGVKDMTQNPTIKIATDLGDINDYDDDWYALAIDSNSADEITGGATAAEGASDWVESNGKIFVCQTSDPDVASVAPDSDTTSLAAVLKTAGYDRTMLFFHRGATDRVDCAMLGVGLPSDPGSINWAYQELSSVSAQSLTSNEISNLMGTIASPTGGKNVNTLTTLAGVNTTRYGTVSSGEFIDVLRYSDFLEARIQERVYTILLANSKVPYTDAGINMVRSEILAQLDQGVSVGALASDPAPTCTAPRAADVSQADKSNRLLSGVTFRATLAGAVNYTQINGQLAL